MNLTSVQPARIPNQFTLQLLHCENADVLDTAFALKKQGSLVNGFTPLRAGVVGFFFNFNDVRTTSPWFLKCCHGLRRSKFDRKAWGHQRKTEATSWSWQPLRTSAATLPAVGPSERTYRPPLDDKLTATYGPDRNRAALKMPPGTCSTARGQIQMEFVTLLVSESDKKLFRWITRSVSSRPFPRRTPVGERPKRTVNNHQGHTGHTAQPDCFQDASRVWLLLSQRCRLWSGLMQRTEIPEPIFQLARDQEGSSHFVSHDQR